MTDLETELARTADREAVVRAWTCRHDDEHLRRLAGSVPDGPLQGWTLGVKDVIDTFDLPTERGSPIYRGRVTNGDASCVALARRAGALVTGKTETTEFALITPAQTTNPHNVERTPGGSSSGSAAAVADRMVRAAFGTQTVGSVLRPAAYCGVVGFKPTHQLIPLTGVASLSPSSDTVGWFTRSVTDAQQIFETMTAQPAAAAPSAVHPTAVPDRPRRLARYRSHQWASALPETAEVLDAAADRLREAGVEVVEVEPLPHLAPVFAASGTVMDFEITRVFAWEREHHDDLLSPLFKRMLAKADNVSFSDYRRAQRVLADARRTHHDVMRARGFDAFLTVSAPGEAPPIKTTGDSVFNRVWTALGVPAIHLPTGTGPNGLPLGIQLTGSSWADGELLTTAQWVEPILGDGRS